MNAKGEATVTTNPLDGNVVVNATDAQSGYEPGIQTTEFWASSAVALVTEVVGLAAAFGLQLSGAQQAAILALTQTVVAIVVGIYTLSRARVKSA